MSSLCFFVAKNVGRDLQLIPTTMGFLDNLKQEAQNLSNQVQTKASQFKNTDFANGCMAMCALIASADGVVDSSERAKTAALIGSNETLKIFSASDLKTKFDFYVDKINADADFGRIETIQAIAKLKSKPDQARAVVQIGIVIGGADGNFDKNEMKAVRDACLAAGLPPADFDV